MEVRGYDTVNVRRFDVKKDIVAWAVKECIAIYDEAVHQATVDTIYGNAPKAMLIKYGKGNIKEFLTVTDIWDAWYYSEGNLRETDKTRKPERAPVSGMFYSEALAEFAVDEERQQVYLNYYFGPRYGRGLRYTVEEQGDLVRLCKVEHLWMS